ncbi:hypothetical protein D3C73_1584600 [compost metagenome]
MRCQASQQVANLGAPIHQQARRRIPHVELRVVLHHLDEIEFILSQKGIAVHGLLERYNYKVIGDCS